MTETPDDPADLPSLTRRLAAFMSSARHAELPADVEELAALHLLDTLASIVACRDLHAGEVARRYAAAHSNGSGSTPILGTPDRASLLDATFASAIIAHGAEINDFCPSAYVQPGPSIVSTGVLVGADRDRTGTEVLRAVAAGYEVSCRFPKAIGIDVLRRSGVANHSVGSLFGAATTAAALMDLDENQCVDLLAYCAQQASGSWQWLLDVEHLEKAFVFGGMAVHNALHAALLVEAGFTGVPDALDVDGGWLRAGLHRRVEDPPVTQLVDGLGQDFQLDLVGFKRFPVGGPVQPVVQGLLTLMAGRGDRAFSRVRVDMPGAARTFAGAHMPALNIPYLASIIAIDGELDFVAAQSRDRLLGDDEVRSLMQRVEVVHDPGQDTVPRSESATVSIDWADGSAGRVHVDHVRGYPSHPMSADDVVAKASALMSPLLGDDRASMAIDLALGLGEQPSPQPLIEAIARP
ncbi:MAG: MmgE/PrpD family protein [Acidimicrobiales bacterium]